LWNSKTIQCVVDVFQIISDLIDLLLNDVALQDTWPISTLRSGLQFALRRPSRRI